MIKPIFVSDERMQIIAARIAFIVLGLTQTAMLGIILYRRFVLEQSNAQVLDLRILLMVSVFGYIAARLYFGAVLPILSFKKLLIIYICLTIVLAVTLSLWLGMPALDNWQNTILPAVLGPAILVSGYGLIAWLGKKRVEKEIS